MPSQRRATLVTFIVNLAIGCADQTDKPPATPPGEQSYAEAIRLICSVDAAAGVQRDTGPLEAEDRRTEFLQQRVKNPDGIYFYTIFTTKDPKQQASELRKEASESGIRSCALADTLEQG